MSDALRSAIEAAWERRAELSPSTTGADRDAVHETLRALNHGKLRVAEPDGDADEDRGWRVNVWAKQAVLLSFRLRDSEVMDGGLAYDKVPLKFAGWSARDFAGAGIRVVPGALVRHSAYVAPGAVLMPCFVNLGAHIGARSMIDTWATVGSCAQVGADCHVSGGAGIGGVLEPLQAAPVIIKDGCFIGARSEVAEGVVVGRGSVIAMGVYLGASTKILDRATGAISRGRVPPYSVVVPGVHEGLACAVIVKRVDAQTRSKTSINELLRD